MGQLAERLEDLVSELNSAEGTPEHRDRCFAAVQDLLAPRIARMIRSYGLADMVDDARQAAAIGIHRALASYVPARSRFTTHVTWQIRGELQGLRHRMRLDQRQSARSANAHTISLDAALENPASRVWEIVDERALEEAEIGAAGAMAHRCFDHLWENYAASSPSASTRDRAIFVAHLTETAASGLPQRWTREQSRQVIRRVSRNLRTAAIDGALQLISV